MLIFKCKMCGGSLSIEEGKSVATCDYCGTKQTLPKLNGDWRANLYDRANHFRRQNDFDKAAMIFETILNEDKTDAEAYWSLVLCKYGVEYVEDPKTQKRIPTCNRTQYTSVLADENYKQAIANADNYQRSIYIEEAKTLDAIQKGILEISSKEEPYDVFICYKEADENGKRTRDSALAQDVYYQLTQEGFKVFFSRITLEDKLGRQYEPYIFAALNSAKVMLVIGSKPEYFKAVWVKNEWSRYLKLMQEHRDKILIPCYREMDAYDLPDELSMMQSQDMGKIGFIQDLIRGVKKVVVGAGQSPAKAASEPVVVPAGLAPGIDSLYRRALLFLEDKDWNAATSYFDKILDIDPENARAYVGKLTARMQLCHEEELKDATSPLTDDSDYQKAVRFADEEYKAVLTSYNKTIEERLEHQRKKAIYDSASGEVKLLPSISSMRSAQIANTAEECRRIANIFNSISDYSNAAERRQQLIDLAYEYDVKASEKAEQERIAEERAYAENKRQAEIKRIAAEKQRKRIKMISSIAIPIIIVCTVFLIVLFNVIIPKQKYNAAISKKQAGDYDGAMAAFELLGTYSDAADQAKEIHYQKAEVLLQSGDYDGAAQAFSYACGYGDALKRAYEIRYAYLSEGQIATAYNNIIGLKADGTVVAVGGNNYGQTNVGGWTDIVAVTVGDHHAVGLKADGTVVAVGRNDDGQTNVSGWTDIVAVAAGNYYTVGLKADGTVVTDYGHTNVGFWTDIMAVAAGSYHTVGLKRDGTVVAVGYNDHGQINVRGWTDIVAVAVGSSHTVGLKRDGTVVAVGRNNSGQTDVGGWTDIVAVAAGSYHTVGLKRDGTVVAVGHQNYDGKTNVGSWTDIVAVAAGSYHTVGLKRDGTVVTVGYNDYGQTDVDCWTNIGRDLE